MARRCLTCCVVRVGSLLHSAAVRGAGSALAVLRRMEMVMVAMTYWWRLVMMTHRYGLGDDDPAMTACEDVTAMMAW